MTEAVDDAYVVVVNLEEQYSILKVDSITPPGWTVVGDPGSKAACLDHIEKVWVDMRPRSLREKLAAEAT